MPERLAIALAAPAKIPGQFRRLGADVVGENSSELASFDLLVATTGASWPAVRAARSAGVPVIWHLQEGVEAFASIAKIPEFRAALDLADLLITPDRRTAVFYSGITRTKMEVISNDLPPDLFDARLLELIQTVIAQRAASLKSNGGTYQDWLEKYDTITAADRVAWRRRLRSLRRVPLISILLPVYNPDLKFLRVAIDSVAAQIYPEWELCLADDASTDPAVRPFLEAVTAAEPRIKLVFRDSNGHISAATNSALALARGEWCALLDQDDELAEDALAAVACEISANPEARLIYSDEDKVDSAGARSEPYFKTDWDPELFLAQNYINHLGVYQTALIRELGGFREGYEGSQDYDLALRCLERIRPEQVRHIPRILYHWRSAPGSVAATSEAKPYAKDAARRALTNHLERTKIAGRIEACPENSEAHRVVYPIPEPAPLVTIIIPTRDRVALLRRCLESLRRLTTYPSLEIIVVDNGSSEPEALECLRGLEAEAQARVISAPGAFNFSRLNNRGAAAASGEILAFLNNDIEVTEPDWLREMVSHTARAEVAAVGARLWYADGTLQHGGVVLGLGGVAGHAFPRMPRGHHGYFDRAILQRRCSAVTGACLLTRREVFAQLGGFDEENLRVNFNDIDYCLRAAERGLATVWTPYANLIHDESVSRGHHRTPEEQAQFFREATYMQKRHGAILGRDPFYNPNLSLQLPGYELGFPPHTARSLPSGVNLLRQKF